MVVYKVEQTVLIYGIILIVFIFLHTTAKYLTPPLTKKMSKMKKQIATTTAAIFLGVVVMLMPILTYTQFLSDNGTNTLEAGSSEQRDSYESTTWKTLDEAAHKIGKIKTSTTSFTTNLTQTILITASSLLVALITSIVIGSKVKLAVENSQP